MPCIQRKREDLKLGSNYPALAIYDKLGIFFFFDANNIFVVKSAPKLYRPSTSHELVSKQSRKGYLGKKLISEAMQKRFEEEISTVLP